MKQLEQFVPLHSKEVEEAIIGMMIELPNLAPVAFDTLVSDYFYTDSCKKYFTALKRLNDGFQTIDTITLVTSLKKNNELSEDDIYNIGQIVANTRVDGFDTHSKILIEYYIKRKIAELGVDFLNKGKDETTDPFDIMNTAATDLMKIQESVTKGVEITIEDIVDQVFEMMEKAKETGRIGLDTGLNALNKKIKGWVEPDLIILAARPGMGKTALMLSTAKYLAVDQGIPIAIFSLEMSNAQLVQRLLSIISGVPHEKIRSGTLSEQEEDLVNEAGIILSKSPIHLVDTAGMNINQIRTKATIFKRKYGIKMIFIDYLQIMSGVNERGKNREAVISEISRGCKQLAKELQVPVVALSQLNRSVEKSDNKMPMLSDLRESGAIEQDADEVIFLVRPEYYDMKEIEIEGEILNPDGLVIANVAKNRHGSTGKVVMQFVAPCMRFQDHFKDIKAAGQFDGWTPENDTKLFIQNPF